MDRAGDPGARRKFAPGEVRSTPGQTVILPGVGAWESQVLLLPSREAANVPLVVGAIPREAPAALPRPALLAKLDQVSRGVQVLTGPRGAGSTQLAAAYARAKVAAGWRLVAWINAGSIGDLMAGLAAVADAAGLSDGGSEPYAADAGRAVRRWLETDGDRCLLVFDDAEDPEVLRPYVPRGDARVLIIGPRQPSTDLGSHVRVEVFDDDEALAFLARRTGLADTEGAAGVAAELGNLPLALAQAAATIAGQDLSYEAYLDRLRTVSARTYPARPQEEAYPPSVVGAVLLSLQAVRAADRPGVSIRAMEIMAVLSAAGIRRELLHAAGKAGLLASSKVSAELVDRVLEWLSNRSLLTLSVDGRTITMKRLVARAVRGELTRQHRLAACWTAAAALEAYAAAVAESPDRGATTAIPKQVTALLDNAAGLAETSEDLAEALLRLRFIALFELLELGDSMQAIAVGEPLIADLERLLSPGHPSILNVRNSLAAAYLAVGRAAEAIQLFQQTLADRERLLGDDHPDTLTSQNNLAAAYQDAGQAAEAIRLYELNLGARERLLGPDHPSTLNSRGNLATAYREAGRTAEAILLLERTMAGREQVLGSDHPDTRTSRRNLAAAYRDVGRDAEALRVLGGDHPDTRTSRRNPAAAHRDKGRPAKAAPPVERTLTGPGRQPPVRAAGRAAPAGFSRPPADPARRVLPAAFRRPPADAARRVLPHRGVRPAWTPGPPAVDVQTDREIATAITAGDQAGISMAYDRYAAALYGYCRSMLHDPARAAEAVQDTFVIAAATLSKLPEVPALRPWLYARARTECQRLLARTPARARARQPDPDDPVDGIGREASQAQLRALIDTILAELKPREREAIELSFRHELSGSDLAEALGMPGSRATALAERARRELEEALRALRVALSGRAACPELGKLLVDWDGRLTEQTHDTVVGHIEDCQTCAGPGPGALRPSALASLLPMAPLPPQLREQVLDRCSAITKDAVAYRRQVARRAESTWLAAFSQAIRRVSWDNIKANPGIAVATAAVVLWVATAVGISLFTFARVHDTSAQPSRPAVRTSSSSPAAAAIAPDPPTSSAATTSLPDGRPSLANVPSSVRRPPSPSALLVLPSSSATSPSPKASRSPSAKPSKSPSPSPSRTASSSPSGSPSPSRSATPSPSATP